MFTRLPTTTTAQLAEMAQPLAHSRLVEPQSRCQFQPELASPLLVGMKRKTSLVLHWAQHIRQLNPEQFTLNGLRIR
ncbi:unannotated protein [freshwater metagenome]|uniref:Unannotated protein n=1 Tax=freshwater metagenome TaxID=449393 RepID=A0A6J6ERA5_9ZZZZ